MRFGRVVGLLMAAMLVTGLGRSPDHDSPQASGAPPALSGWVVYWDEQDSRQALDIFASALEEIVVFAYHFDEQGQIVPANPWVAQTLDTLMAAPEAERPRVLVSVVNDVVTSAGDKRLKDAQIVHEALATEEARAAHLEALLQVAATADGIELDYENLRAQDRQALSRFVQELGQALHARGQRLAVVVQPKLDDRIKDGAGAWDWAAIGREADEVKLMAYHFHHASGTPGPVAPPEWVERLAEFALTQIPPEKLCVALTLHGFDWAAGQPGRALDYSSAMRLAQAHGADPRRDRPTGTLTFRYHAEGVVHDVWIDDAQSLSRKIERLRARHVRAIGLWHLGAGAEMVQPLIETVRPATTTGAPPYSRQAPRP